MNLGSLMDMIQKDPTIPSDIDGFLERVNAPSLAERNGGVATKEEVLVAIKTLRLQPLVAEAQRVYDDTVAKIQSGEITKTEEIPGAV